MTIKVGDSVKVIRKHYGWEPYEVGDEFVVSEVDNECEYPEGAILSVEDYNSDYMMFTSEVEKVEADLFDELVEGLTQAIEAKEADAEIPSSSMAVQQSIEIASRFPPSIGFGEGEHGMLTQGKRTPADAVNSPSHYTQGGVEVIDIIAQTVSGYDDSFTAHCVGTATKYLNRAPHKHATPLEDLEKAAKYIEFAIKHEKKKAL